MTVPDVPRMAHLSLLAFEAALTAQARNGAGPSADVVYTIGRLALTVPETASRCPAVRAALPPDVLAVVVMAQVSAVAGSGMADGGEVRAVSVGVPAAAVAIGFRQRRVRQLCQAGAPAPARPPHTGQGRGPTAAPGGETAGRGGVRAGGRGRPAATT